MENKLNDMEQLMNRSWKQMEELLDVHMPIKKKSKRRFWYYFPILIATGIIVVYLWMKFGHNGLPKELPSNQTSDQNPIAQNIPLSAGKIKAILPSSNISQRSISEKKINTPQNQLPIASEGQNSEVLNDLTESPTPSQTQKIEAGENFIKIKSSMEATLIRDSESVSVTTMFNSIEALPRLQSQLLISQDHAQEMDPIPTIKSAEIKSSKPIIWPGTMMEATYLSALNQWGVSASLSGTIVHSDQFIFSIQGGYTRFIDTDIDSTNGSLQERLVEKSTLEFDQFLSSSKIFKLQQHRMAFLQCKFYFALKSKLYVHSGIRYAFSKYTLNSQHFDLTSIPKIGNLQENKISKHSLNLITGLQYKLSKPMAIEVGMHWMDWKISGKNSFSTNPAVYAGIQFNFNR